MNNLQKACKQADYQANNCLKSNRIIQIADDGYLADNTNATGLTAKDKVVVLNTTASVAMKMFGCRIIQAKNNHMSRYKGFDSTISGNSKSTIQHLEQKGGTIFAETEDLISRCEK